jgi:hypothetical protein
MRADITLKSTVQEATVIIDAVQHYRMVQIWNSRAVEATADERLEAGRLVLECERILRGFGAEPAEVEDSDRRKYQTSS